MGLQPPRETALKSLAFLLLAATLALHALAEDAAGLRRQGFMYYDGKGVKQDIARGVSFFERAAAAGDLESQSNLCVMYEQAIFVAQDYGRAAAWCLEAAEQGDVPSQMRLAELVYLGRGVPRDVVEGSKWWNVMRLTQPPDRLAHHRRTMELAEARLSAEQLGVARARAQRWVEAHAAGR